VSAYVTAIGKYGGSATSKRLPMFISAVSAFSLTASDSVSSLAVVFRDDIMFAFSELSSMPACAIAAAALAFQINSPSRNVAIVL